MCQSVPSHTRRNIGIRICAKSPITGGWVALVWKSLSTQVGCVWDSEQWVYAKRYDIETYSVRIATEDDDRLRVRAFQGLNIPPSWSALLEQKEFWGHERYEQIGKRGVGVPFPELPADQLCELRFVVLCGEIESADEGDFLTLCPVILGESFSFCALD